MSGKPQELSDIQPEITLYHRNSGPDGEIFNEISFLQMDKRRFIAGNVIFIVHGFRGTSRRPWMLEMKAALLKHGPKSMVLVVGWGNHTGYGASALSLGQATANFPPVGEWLARYTRMIKEACPDAYLHGIGFSLGAHVLGVAGRLSQAFDRITGLDPSGPSSMKDIFTVRSRRAGVSDGLCSTDAKDLVDVIHTDGRSFCGAGTLTPMGTVDFYPNGGKHQPKSKTPADSHRRAYALFIWSISHPGEFKTNHILDRTSSPEDPMWVKSRTSVEMGYHCTAQAEKGAKYYIFTEGGQPWV